MDTRNGFYCIVKGRRAKEGEKFKTNYYILQSLTEGSENLVYVGRTTKDFDIKLRKDLNAYNCWKNGKGNFISYFRIFELGEFKVELLECFETEFENYIEYRHKIWADEMKERGKNVVNIEYGGERWTGEDNDLKVKKEKRREYNKKWWDKNKEKWKEEKNEYSKNWYLSNKEWLKKRYNEKKKEGLSLFQEEWNRLREIEI